MKETFLILPYSALKSSSTVQHCNSASGIWGWHQVYGQEELLTKRRWEMVEPKDQQQ